jgi:hypothetical protein
MKDTITLILAMLISISSLAQNKDLNSLVPNKSYAGLHFEDDVFFPGNKDEQYSGGIEAEFVTRVNAPCNRLLNPFQAKNYSLIGTYGFTVFTPDSIYPKEVIRSDRPYSSYQYISIGYVGFEPEFKRKFRSQLYLGAFGSSFPNRVQNWSHTVLTPDTDSARGWDNQIGNGGRFAANLELALERQFLTIKSKKIERLDLVQLTSVAQTNIGGYLNSLNYGLKLNLFSYNSHLSTPISPAIPEGFLVEEYTGHGSKKEISGVDTFSNGRIATRNFLNNFRFNKKKESHNKGSNFAFNIYAFPEARYIFHSTALEGFLYNDESPYALTRSEVNRFIWNWEFGTNVVIARHFHLGYSVQLRSQEHKKFKQDWHTFGALSMGWTW